MPNLWRKGSEEQDLLSREQHSAVLRRYQKRKGEEAPATAPTPAPGAEAAEGTNRREAGSAGETATEPSPGAPRVISRSRTSLQLEQTLSYAPGMGRDGASVSVRLTTACRGQRKPDGLVQVGYLLRLEVLSLSPGLHLEGFSLGPWQAEGLSLEAGAIVTPDPVWASFQSATGTLQGRLRVEDTLRRRLLDLPWRTVGLVPGPEPFPG